MKYVIIRDDDTCAVTPVACLERLYRPFLDRGLPVNLAVIPNVNTRATFSDGKEEGFLCFKGPNEPAHRPIGSNPELLAYLRANPGFKALHHGYEHNYLEFDQQDPASMGHKLDEGRRYFEAAGFTPPQTFVAPYDQLSRASYRAVAQRFQLLSTGWFELPKLPPEWWPQLILKKALKRPHWRAGDLTMLSHPGCLLSYRKPLDSMLPTIQKTVSQNYLTVLVTHWWEYFFQGQTNEAYIAVLHQTAAWLASQPDIQVIPFSAIEDPGSPILRRALRQ